MLIRAKLSKNVRCVKVIDTTKEVLSKVGCRVEAFKEESNKDGRFIIFKTTIKDRGVLKYSMTRIKVELGKSLDGIDTKEDLNSITQQEIANLRKLIDMTAKEISSIGMEMLEIDNDISLKEANKISKTTELSKKVKRLFLMNQKLSHYIYCIEEGCNL